MREIRAYGSVGAPEGNLRRYPAGLRTRCGFRLANGAAED